MPPAALRDREPAMIGRSLIPTYLLRAAVVAALAIFTAWPADGQVLSLHVLSIEAPAGIPDPHGPLHVRLEVDSPEILVERFGGQIEDGMALLPIGLEGLAPPEPPEGRLGATFVIDYDEDPVQALVEELLAAHPEPSVEILTGFTHDAIPHKTIARGFDLASRVATRREGDCTEHAVLLTALARASGRPARLVHGIVLLWGEDGMKAFGHAWAEIHDGERWRRADATRIDEEETVRYLPLSVQGNEGPGFGLEQMESLQIHPRRIEVFSASSGMERGSP